VHVTEHSNSQEIIALVGAVRENLDRIEKLLCRDSNEPEELDTRSPLNKIGLNLTPRGVEVCYRLYDAGKSRYAVAQALEISFGAATHRFHAWEKLGGIERERRQLE
jgi:hypothetical protein